MVESNNRLLRIRESSSPLDESRPLGCRESNPACCFQRAVPLPLGHIPSESWHGRSRTDNLRSQSPPLFQLSYVPSQTLPLGFEPRPSALTVRRNAGFARAEQRERPDSNRRDLRRQRSALPLGHVLQCARWESDPRCFSLATTCHATRRRTRDSSGRIRTCACPLPGRERKTRLLYAAE